MKNQGRRQGAEAPRSAATALPGHPGSLKRSATWRCEITLVKLWDI